VILRIVGPLVVVSTVFLLGTGAALLAVGPAHSTSKAGRLSGVGLRRGIVLASLIVGLALGAASLRWNIAWTHRARRREAAPLTKPIMTGSGVGRMGTSD
jgi:hypothetical protein